MTLAKHKKTVSSVHPSIHPPIHSSVCLSICASSNPPIYVCRSFLATVVVWNVRFVYPCTHQSMHVLLPHGSHPKFHPLITEHFSLWGKAIANFWKPTDKNLEMKKSSPTAELAEDTTSQPAKPRSYWRNWMDNRSSLLPPMAWDVHFICVV